MANRVALIGCGVMGGAIGTRLCEVGETLTVFDIDEARMLALAGRGAVTAGSAAEAATKSDYVILSLNSAEIVREAVFGPHGVAAGAKPGTHDHRHVVDRPAFDPRRWPPRRHACICDGWTARSRAARPEPSSAPSRSWPAVLPKTSRHRRR